MTKWNSADISEIEVRQQLQIWINNVGVKSNPMFARECLTEGQADFMLDCRGIPDAVAGLGHHKNLEDYVEKQIDLGIYLHVILQAIHAVPKRRRDKGPNWAKYPFKITTFCAHGMHRSRAMRNLIARELKALGYQVTITDGSYISPGTLTPRPPIGAQPA